MENGKNGPTHRIIRPLKIYVGVPKFICCLFLKDIEAKGDLDVKFHDDDDDDNILAAISDPLTKPRSSPSRVTSTVTTNLVQSVPYATETGPTVSQSRATTTPAQSQHLDTESKSTDAQVHVTNSSIMTTPAQIAPLDTETTPVLTDTRASQLQLQLQVSTDQSPGLSGHLPDTGICFQDLFKEKKNRTF